MNEKEQLDYLIEMCNKACLKGVFTLQEATNTGTILNSLKTALNNSKQLNKDK